MGQQTGPKSFPRSHRDPAEGTTSSTEWKPDSSLRPLVSQRLILLIIFKGKGN